jgi:3-oxoacyl-[acyl-carrier protein] reductase
MGSLSGRVALVTGVSRRASIGFTVANRLAGLGASVFTQSWRPHDDEQPWGADAERLPGHLEADFADPDAPAAVVDAVVDRFGALDIVVAAHARSANQDLAALTAAELDYCFGANVRGSLLLVQRFAEIRDHSRPGGRVVLFTSGQHLGPMPGELPYIVSKGALQQVTASLAAGLAPRRVTVNCVNPGPNDTGWADRETHRAIEAEFPFGRWGTPSDTADLIEFLVSDAGGWLTGQTLVSDGGFSLA